MGALAGLRIVELAEGVAGEYCGKLLADMGAELIKVERPGSGSPVRSLSPLVKGPGGGEESALFAYLNTNKRSVTLDMSAPDRPAAARGLIASAAAVIDDHDGEWLKDRGFDPARFQSDFPGVVFTSLTHFGLLAPREFAASRSINVMHASGWGYHTGSHSDPEKPPLKGPGRYTIDFDGAIDAAMCTMAGLIRRQRTGTGDFIDLSLQAALTSRADHVVGRMLAHKLGVSDERSAYGRAGPIGAYRCADGYIHFYAVPAHWPALITLLGDPAWAADFAPDWLFNVTQRELTTFVKHFTEWASGRKRDRICDDAQKLGLPIVQVNSAADLLESEHLAARGFFHDLDHPVLGAAQYPMTGYKFSATPVRLDRPAPALGQDNGLLASPPARPVAVKSSASPADRSDFSRAGPLAGIRVLEITKVWAGPYAGKLLAMLGAEVIKVESRKTLDSMRMFDSDDIDKSAMFHAINPEVLSVQVNLKSDKGFKHLQGMIAQSDIVIDNLRPGAMERMGIDYANMRKIRDDIIHVSLRMNGATGPAASQTGYAPSFAALSGLSSLVGYDGEPPCGVNMFYGDTTAGATVAMASVAALLHRELTGHGQYVDVSATEALSALIGDTLFEFGLTGKVPRPDANRHPDMAPHGAYPCLDDEWISIAVDREDIWRRLCEVVNRAGLAADPRFATLAARQANLFALDRELGMITRRYNAEPLAALLRQSGVPAHKSASSRDLISDTNLWARRTFTTVRHRNGEVQPLVGAPWRFSQAQARLERAAPAIGEHNVYVYCELLGLSEGELAELIAEGAVE